MAASGEMSNLCSLKMLMKNLESVNCFNTITFLKSKITSIKKECNAIQSNPPDTYYFAVYLHQKMEQNWQDTQLDICTECLEIHSLSLHRFLTCAAQW